MKLFKKNQIIIYIIVFMLMVVGYLNYTTNTEQQSLETSIQMESSDDKQIAGIGDAKLVSSNDIVSENATNATENMMENTTLETNSNPSNDYFVKSKMERDTMYSQMIETYEKILNNTNAIESQKQIATEEIQKINDTKNSIMICENLIKTKGFENSVIFVNDESISAIIEAEEMQQEKIAQIQNIIAREMKAEIENIHIATK